MSRRPPAPVRTRLARLGAAVASSLALAGCGHDATAPKKVDPKLRVVAGAGLTDTVQAQPIQALVVEVRDSTGRQMRGAVVRFEGVRPTDPARQSERAIVVCTLTTPVCGGDYYSSPTDVLIDTTRADGRASVMVRFGTVAGTANVRVTVPVLGLADSAIYTVTPGAPAKIAFSVPDTMVRVGGSYAVSAAAADRFSNRRADAIAYAADGVVASVDAAGTVKGLTPGRGSITASVGDFHGSASVSVVPVGHIAAYRATYGSTALVELDLDGSGFVVRTPTSGQTNIYPTWSPDGSRITYTEAGGAYGLQLLTISAQGAVTNAVADGTVGLSEEGQYSRDGAYLYFYGMSSGGGCCLWRIAASGGASAELMTAAGSGSQPSPSPDGTRVAFNESGGIDVLTLATNTVQRLGVGGSFTRWAPTGETIAYTSNDGQLSVVNADGSGRRSLGIGFNVGIDWSPDGQWLIGSRGGQLTLVRVSDGLSLPLHTTNRELYMPIWKP